MGLEKKRVAHSTHLRGIAALDFSFREAFPVFPHYFLDEVNAVETCRSNNCADNIKSSIVTAARQYASRMGSDYGAQHRRSF